MWFFTSVEFPSDNQDLWRAQPPAAPLAILVTMEPPASVMPTSMTMEDLVLETLTQTPPITDSIEVAVEEVVDVEVEEFSDEAFADAIDDSSPPPPIDIPVPLESMVAPKMGTVDTDDPALVYLQTLKDVSVAFGASAVFAETLDAILGREPMCIDDETGAELVTKGLALATDGRFEPNPAIVRVACAWQSAFRGDEPDFSVCSSMLDEWSADVVAKLLGRKELVDPIRRELRSRGVAAFGLLEAA